MNLNEKIHRLLDKKVSQVIALTGDAAKEAGMRVYLVGGVVRDLLRNEASKDVDIAVEGDAISLASKLKQKTSVTTHPSFGTATLKISGIRIDLATARSERYASPGALPEVTPGNINNDLFRRDFTVNAMAVSLNAGTFGELIDPFYGVDDLGKGLIRVLHDKSFADDPTRIWRAVRYEQRLNLKIEQKTLELLRDGISGLKLISGDRVRHELELVLKEQKPEKALLRASQLGILNTINPALNLLDNSAVLFKEATKSISSEAVLISVYYCLLFSDLNRNEVEKIVYDLRVSRSIVRDILQNLELKEKLTQLSRENLSPSEIYALLTGCSDAALIAYSIKTQSVRARQVINEYLSKLKNEKTCLNGDDLKEIGITAGPKIKKALDMLLSARLDGKVSTRQSEIDFINSHFMIRGNNIKN